MRGCRRRTCRGGRPRHQDHENRARESWPCVGGNYRLAPAATPAGPHRRQRLLRQPSRQALLRARSAHPALSHENRRHRRRNKTPMPPSSTSRLRHRRDLFEAVPFSPGYQKLRLRIKADGGRMNYERRQLYYFTYILRLHLSFSRLDSLNLLAASRGARGSSRMRRPSWRKPARRRGR